MADTKGPATVYIHVELLPPAYAEGYNQEQALFVVVDRTHKLRTREERRRDGSVQAYTVLSAAVNPNPARVDAKVKPFYVPVALHYSEGRIRLTAYADRACETDPRWSYTLDYDVPLTVCEPREPNQFWHYGRDDIPSVSPEVLTCSKSLRAIAEEPWEYRGETYMIEFRPPHPQNTPPVILQLGVRKACMATEKKDTPMTYWMGRMIALTDIFVILAHDPFAIVPPIQ